MDEIYAFSYNGKRYEFTDRNELHKFVKKLEPMKGDKKLVVLVTDDTSGKYQCKDCTMYVPDLNQCTNVLGHIEPHGTCIIRVSGKPATADKINPYRLLKDEANYDERDEGFGCIRCIRFHAPSICRIIKNAVKWNYCCNFQFDGNISKSESITEKYADEQKYMAKERLKKADGDPVKVSHELEKLKKSDT